MSCSVISNTYKNWEIFRSLFSSYLQHSKRYSKYNYRLLNYCVPEQTKHYVLSIDSNQVHKVSGHSSLLSCAAWNQLPRHYTTARDGTTCSTELISPKIQDVKHFLAEKQIKFEQGHACLTLLCPNLKVSSEKKGAKLFINEITGYFYCDACKKRGTWFELKDSIHSLSLQKKTKKEACFKEDLKRIDANSVQFIDCFKNCTPLIDLCGEEYDTVISSFGLGGLKSVTLSNFAVEFEKVSNSLIFPAFAFDSTLVSVKKLTCKVQEDGTWAAPKESSTPRSGLSGLFGWSLARSESKEVVFTPSEKDAMVVYQETKLPAIALPKGYNTLPQEVLPQLEQFKKIILWFGSDLQAWNSAKKFAKKLGEKRCYVIRPSNEEPCPYEALKQNLDLKKILAKAKRINHDAIVSFSHLRQEVFSEITQPDQVKGVKWQRFPDMNTILKGHRQGELTVFTGPTGSGKTTFMSEYSLDLCMQGVNTLWGSFEIQNVRLAKKMLFQFARVNFTEHPDQFEEYADQFEDLHLHFMAFHGSVSRFSKCDKCVLYKTKLSKTGDKEERLHIQRKREKHLRKQNIERQKYYKHANKAKRLPDKFLSIIIDGMDQNKTMIPHTHMPSKTMSMVWKLKMHLTGAIVHGVGTYGFFDFCQFPHGSNLTITVLLNIFAMMDHLPDTLYLQMDNCGRENKNRFVLGFLCLLVEKQIFRKIKVSFLMVGHTHEDIDRVFSRFSNWLSRHSANTMDTLINGWQDCQNPNPIGIRVEDVFDVSGWLEQYLEHICNHSFPHSFKITKQNGKAKIMWKQWTTDLKWQECTNSETKSLLKSDVQGKPNLMEPNLNKLDLAKLESDIIDKSAGFLNENELQWWGGFFTELAQIDTFDKQTPWVVDHLEQKETFATPIATEGMTADSSGDEDTHPPVQLGIHKPKEIINKETMKEDDLCLVDMAKYVGEWPQLGRIVKINGDNITLHWYRGSLTTSWKPCTHRVNGKVEPWLEEVCLKTIYHYGFKLTPSSVIKKCTRRIIEDYESSY